MPTDLIQHLVTLIEDEDLHTIEAKLLLANQCVQPTRCCDDDVGVGIFVGKRLNVLLHWSSTVEDTGLDLWQIFGKARILVLDLIRELTRVAHDKNRALARCWFDLLEGRKNEDRCFSQSRLGLAKNICSEDCLWNAYLLDCEVRAMLDLNRSKKSEITTQGPSEVRPSLQLFGAQHALKTPTRGTCLAQKPRASDFPGITLVCLAWP